MDDDVRLNVPRELLEEIRQEAGRDAVSVRDYVVSALAEKVEAARQFRALEARAARVKPGDYLRILEAAGRPVAIPGDELPDTPATP